MFSYELINNILFAGINLPRIKIIQMEKQKLADLVMQKMREKKEKEDKNRPHFEVLRLEVVFQQEIHDSLK